MAVNIPLWDQISDLFSYGTQENSLGLLVTNGIDLLVIASVIIGLVFLLIGAINWITAEGKPDKLEHARNTVIHALVGLVLAVAAYAIWLLVVKQFLGINIDTGINLSGPPGTGITSGSGAGSGGAACSPQCAILDYSGSGYCSKGITQVQCCPSGSYGTGSYPYWHFEPVACKDPTALPAGGVTFGGCTGRPPC